MLDRRRLTAKTVPIRPEVHARFLDVIKRAEVRAAEATTSVRHALARAKSKKSLGVSGWRARAAESRARQRRRALA